MKKILLGVLLCWQFALTAQFVAPVGTISNALAGATITLVSLYATASNPALLTEIKKLSVGMSVENKYFLPGLKKGIIGANIKFAKTNAIGIVAAIDGTQYLRNSMLFLGYAKKINEKVNIGGALVYYNTWQESFTTSNIFTCNIGLITKPNKNVILGAAVFNPLLLGRSKSSYKQLPVDFTTGIKYLVSPQVALISEFRMDLNNLRNFKLGMSYALQPNFLLYCGFQNANAPLGFGCTFKNKNIAIHIAFQYHQKLGFSPASGLEYASN